MKSFAASSGNLLRQTKILLEAKNTNCQMQDTNFQDMKTV